MIASMTGFGRAEEVFEGGCFTVEIRSVNHRFLDFSIRLPKALGNFEVRIKELVKKKINRGYINFQLSWDKDQEGIDSLILNEEKIKRYKALFLRMNEEFGIEGGLTLEVFSRLTDVFKTEAEPEDEEKLWPVVERATNQALDALIQMRQREGEALAADISSRLEEMDSYMRKANLKAPERLARLEMRLLEKVRSILGEGAVDENRLLTEITFYSDKWDFSEEDVRFRSHLEAMREAIKNGGPVGRKLGFLTQELNREVNTVAAKANDSSIAQFMVAVKEEIEKVREQVENIE
ncbi:MAG TPA: YicC/YloC family endoribonuclease [archaeon]|nr:YicC/YloC family endoribonuclease [archaeon]